MPMGLLRGPRRRCGSKGRTCGPGGLSGLIGQCARAPVLWIRNGDMVVEGSNEPLEAATSASSHATNCTRTPHTASKPKAIPVTVA
jgi:hypothetical protein